MKKQLRILLFALLVVLMVGTMVVVASAAGDATYTAGTHYYKVEDSYYADLNAAIADVPNGGTIYVLADVPAQTAVVLTKTPGFAYTITSEGTAKYTITMTGGTNKADAFFIGEGAVTLKNLVIADGFTAVEDVWQTLVRSTGNGWAKADFPTLTLENVTAEFSSLYGFWMHQRCDLTIKDSTVINDGGDSMRLNTGSGSNVVNVTNSTLTGTSDYDFFFQSNNVVTFDGCTLTGDIRTNEYAPNITVKNSTLNGRVLLNNSYTDGFDKLAQTVAFENTVINAGEGIAPFYFAEKPGSITVKGGAIHLNGTTLFAQVNGSDYKTYAKTMLLTDVTVVCTTGATPLRVSDFAEGSTIATQTFDPAGTYNFVLSELTGEKAVATAAELVALIKADANYAGLTIPEAWHTVLINNEALKVTVSGDALAQNVIFAAKGVLLPVVKGSATYTEGTHFFKTTIEGTDYYYATIADAITEVVSGGTITMLASTSENALALNQPKAYTIDGAGFTLTLTPALNYDVFESNLVNNYTTTLWITRGDVTIKNITLALAADTTATTMFYLQSYTGDPDDTKLTLENIVAEYATTYGSWLNGSACLTIKGENTKITGGTTDTIRLNGSATGSVVSIEAGTITVPAHGIDIKTSEATVNISGGTFNTSNTSANAFIYSYADSTYNTFNISGGTVNYTATASSKYSIFHNTGRYNTYNFPADGTFVCNAGVASYIFKLNSGGTNGDNKGTVVNIYSGTFKNSMCWMFAKQNDLTVNIGGTAHFSEPDGTLDPATAIASPRYIGGISINNGVVLNISGGIIETTDTNTLPSAIYADGTNKVNISGGVIKGYNNAIRIGGSIVLNISGGEITNIGAANQLIRANYKGTCTINILPGAYLVQDQNQYVAYAQNADVNMIVNMTGGTIINNGTSPIFGTKAGAGANTEIKISGGMLYAKQNYIASMSVGKTLEIKNAILVLKNAEDDKAKIYSTNATGFTGTPVLENITVLYNTSSSFAMGGTTVAPVTYGPKAKFGGELYNLYMDIPSNAEEDIVTEDTRGADLWLAGTPEESGLRFISKLSESAINLAKAALAEGKTVSYGTLIAPADYVAAAGAFTKEALSKLTVPEGKIAYADVPAVASLRDHNGDGVYEEFSAALINIKEENFQRAFAAVAYVVIDGTTYYSAYNTVDNARTIAQLAFDLFNDTSVEWSDEEFMLLLYYMGEEI